MPFRIEICGATGSGKTALARVLRDAFPAELQIALENYREIPFWQDCWSEVNTFEFERDVSFLLHHRHLLAKTPGNLICDFSFQDDLAFSRLSRSPTDRSLFQSIYDRFTIQLQMPSLLLHLTCPAQTLLRRIQCRGRKEEGSVSLAFLEAVTTSIASVLAEFRIRHPEIPILTIETDRFDYVSDASGKASIYKQISPAIKRLLE